MEIEGNLDVQELKNEGSGNNEESELHKQSIEERKLQLAKDAEEAKQNLAKQDLEMKEEFNRQKIRLDEKKINKQTNNK